MVELYAQEQLKRLLMEDTGFGDITSQLLGEKECSGYIILKENCVLSGLEYAAYLFELRGVKVTSLFKDGDTAGKGDKILTVEGDSKSILEVERVALNVLARMSGIATETRALVEKVRKVNPHCRVAATRKSLFRFFDKEAVITGGGDSHRLRLDDMVLLKDNHVKILGIEEAVKRAKKVSFSRKVEIEVSTKEDAVKAADCGADIVMLDNMEIEAVEETVRALKKGRNVLIEVSGGITRENIEAYARTGVDIISIGYITHSVKAVNMSLEVTL